MARRRVDLSPLWERHGIPSEGFESVYSDDEASSRLIRFGRDGHGCREVLVRLWFGSGFSRHLLFRQESGSRGTACEWKLVDWVDTFAHYGPLRHWQIRGSRHRWLVVEELRDRGTGRNYVDDVWLEVKEDGLTEVLRHPGKGYEGPEWIGLLHGGDAGEQIGGSVFYGNRESKPGEGDYFAGPGPGRDVESHIIGVVESPRGSKVRVRFTASFYALPYPPRGDAPPVAILKTRHEVTYVRNSMGRLVQSHRESNISAEKLSALYDVSAMSLTSEGFLRYNMDALKRIAQSPESPRKRWLRHLLNACADTREKSRLVELLSTKTRR